METIRVETSNHICSIYLNRPKLHNAFNDVMIKELRQAFAQACDDPQVRILCLRAEGKSFSAGADLNWMQSMVEYTEQQNVDDAKDLALLLTQLYHFPKPTVALVQGAAFGGGVGLVACCDIAIASDNASFCFSEVKLGLIPAVISPYIVSAIGERLAKRYFISAEKFTALQAMQYGLIHEVVTQDNLEAALRTICDQLLANGPVAQEQSKVLLKGIQQTQSSDELIDYTSRAIAQIRVSKEGQAGLNAFLQKQLPPWVIKQEDND